MSETGEAVPAPPRRARKLTRQVILWLVVVVIFYFIFRRVPVAEVLNAFRMMNPWRFFPIVTAFVIFWFALDSYLHYWVFKRFNIKMGFRQVFEARAASTLLLGIGFFYGQGGMAYLISRKSGKPITEVVGCLLFLVFNTYHSILIMPTFGLLFFMDYFRQGLADAPELRSLIILLAISWPIFFLSIAFWSKSWNFWPRTKAKGGIWYAFDQVRLRDFAVVILLRMLGICVWIVMISAAMPALGLHMPIGTLFAFLPLVQLAGAIPTPGRLGTSEAVWLLLFHNIAPEHLLVAISLAWMQSVNILRYIIGLFFFRHFIKD